jgi:acyl-CoA synthetase (AMP-forming)/AMP-acid ligase II
MHAFGCDVRDIYGLTECTLPICISPLAPLEKKLTVTGSVCPGAEVRIVDQAGVEIPRGSIGHLMLRSPSLMAGYYRNPEATEAAIDDSGWFATGDLAIQDADGYVRLAGRKKDVIIKGGANIIPQEVEEWLARHPAVRQAAAFGVPDASLGEVVCCCVTLHPGTDVSEAELIGHLRASIAGYKMPNRIFIVDDLPTSTTGKVLRNRAKDRWIAELAQP